eukprot:3471634-Rhodomonas_salina.1
MTTAATATCVRTAKICSYIEARTAGRLLCCSAAHISTWRGASSVLQVPKRPGAQIKDRQLDEDTGSHQPGGSAQADETTPARRLPGWGARA